MGERCLFKGYPRLMALYRLTDEDLAIFEASKTNPNIFTEWYFQTPYSGTVVQPGSKRRIIQVHYDALRREWDKQNNPMKFQFETDKVAVREFVNGEPIFHRFHGFRLLPWQVEAWLSDKMTDVFAGGFGSGKSLVAGARMGKNAVTLPGYKGFVLAPQMAQATEIKTKLMRLMYQTRFSKFYVTDTKKPPSLVLGNDMVGETVIEFIPVLEQPQKVKNLEGDEALIDQFEDLEIDNDFKANVVSRLRGFDIVSGREKLGKVTWVGNANSDSPGFLELLEQAKTDPEHYGYFQPDSRDNIYVSDRQLDNQVRQFIKTQEDEDVYFAGIPQAGKGIYFPKASIDKCETKTLNEYMEDGLARCNIDSEFYDPTAPVFVRESLPGIGVTYWETPPKPNRLYLTLADPGWGNPPERNAPALGVLDITHFPSVPAQLVAFAWIPAMGSPDPWLAKFFEYNEVYKTLGRGYYDATGPQKGYERFVKRLSQIGAQPIGLNPGEKDAALTGLRTILATGLLNWAQEITPIKRQLLKFKLPDTNLAQDIVSMLMLMTIHLSPLLLEDEKKQNDDDDGSTFANTRYMRTNKARHTRRKRARR